MTKKQIREYRCMIGAAIARMYEHESREVIFEMLDKSEYFLKSRVTETARIWYLSSASISLLVLIFLFFLLPSPNSGNIFFPGILMGAAGAYLSLVMNSKRIVVNPSSGRTIHFFESITRLIIGMIGGFFTSIIFQAEIITVGFLENHFLNSLIFAFTAGFSERMVPNMIYHFEEVNVKNSAPKTTMES